MAQYTTSDLIEALKHCVSLLDPEDDGDLRRKVILLVWIDQLESEA